MYAYMEQLANEIRLGYADKIVNDLLAAPRAGAAAPYGLRYNQGEEAFVELAEPYTVPSFPIHHDVRRDEPDPGYLSSLRAWIESLLQAAPDFFYDLVYFFDPAEILKPCFFKTYRNGNEYYLYLLRVNLAFRPLESEQIERGDNDRTSAYRSRRLYMESDFIPLESGPPGDDEPAVFSVKQTIAQTWIGETGRGYFQHGIWMDSELTKFFSKLFLPTGTRCYPFYPFTCKYKTLCMTVPDPTAETRRRLLPYLGFALEFLAPEMSRIQDALRAANFSETLPIFTELRSKVDESRREPWTRLRVTPYLNADEQKEFRVEF
jgi:hypothetical protein